MTTSDIMFIAHRKDEKIVEVHVLVKKMKASDVEEIKLYASQCVRHEEDEYHVTIYGSSEILQTNEDRAILLAFKIKLLLTRSNPETCIFTMSLVTADVLANNTITESLFIQVIQFSAANYTQVFQAHIQAKKIQSTEAEIPMKESKIEIFCNCRMPHCTIDPTTSKKIKRPKMIHCSQCQKCYFFPCVNLLQDAKKISLDWKCYQCKKPLPVLLPKWGGHPYTNTCPIDNILAAFMMFCDRHSKYLK